MEQIGKRYQHDMELAGLAQRTQRHYLDAIRDYGKHFGRSPAELGHEDLRVWSRHLLDSGVGDGRLRQHFAALKFLYKKTLAQPDAVAFLSFRGKTGPLLDILSAEEVERTLAAVRRPRFRMLFTTMYATGLRLKEARHLETSDLNAQRGVIVVKHAKGGKTRLVPLSSTLLGQLREYWKTERPPAPYLFPSSVCAAPLSADVARRALKLAAKDAGIRIKVSPHTLRHCFATHLLEAGVELRTIQVLLGHTNIQTTTRYSRVATGLIAGATDLLELLPRRQS
jgi:integrase/recombinase XerD